VYDVIPAGEFQLASVALCGIGATTLTCGETSCASTPRSCSAHPNTTVPEASRKYPAIIRLWTNAWAEFVPFLQFDQEIRTIICTTNAI
jgi:mutator family transposase